MAMDQTNRKFRYAQLGAYTFCVAAIGLAIFLRGLEPMQALALFSVAAIVPLLVLDRETALPLAESGDGALDRWPALFALLILAAVAGIAAGWLVLRQAPGGTMLGWLGGLVIGLGTVTGAAAFAWRRISQFAERRLADAEQHVFTEHEVQEELHTLQIEYRDIFMCHPTPMWIYDPKSLRILSVNDAACAQYGYSRAEFLKMSIAQLRPASEHVALEQYLATTRRTLQDAGVWKHLRKDGSLLDVEIVSHELHWRGRRVRLVNAADVTDKLAAKQVLHDMNTHLAAKVQARTQKVRRYAQRLRRRKRELEMANRDLEMFSYSASHDLKTPLWVMNAFVEMLLKDCGQTLSPDALEKVHKIQDSGRHMMAVMDDLMTLAKVSKRTVHRRIVDVTQLAEAQIALLHSRDPQRDVEVAVAAGLTANVDEGLLTIALENLLSNAWKYSAYVPQASIRFGAWRRDGELVFFVEDNGVGFDMKVAQDLFKPFKRMHSDEMFEGTGIGLAIVQRVVGLHGGRIWAESKPGKGARFSFSLGSEAWLDVQPKQDVSHPNLRLPALHDSPRPPLRS